MQTSTIPVCTSTSYVACFQKPRTVLKTSPLLSPPRGLVHLPVSLLLLLYHLRNMDVQLWIWSSFSQANGRTRYGFEIPETPFQVCRRAESMLASHVLLNTQPESQVGARCCGSGVGQRGRHLTGILQTWGQDLALLLFIINSLSGLCRGFLGQSF